MRTWCSTFGTSNTSSTLLPWAYGRQQNSESGAAATWPVRAEAAARSRDWARLTALTDTVAVPAKMTSVVVAMFRSILALGTGADAPHISADERRSASEEGRHQFLIVRWELARRKLSGASLGRLLRLCATRHWHRFALEWIAIWSKTNTGIDGRFCRRCMEAIKTIDVRDGHDDLHVICSRAIGASSGSQRLAAEGGVAS